MKQYQLSLPNKYDKTVTFRCNHNQHEFLCEEAKKHNVNIAVVLRSIIDWYQFDKTYK